MNLFSREIDDAPSTEINPNHHTFGELQEEYLGVANGIIARCGLNPDCIEVEARYAGQSRAGKHLFKLMFRLVKWERHSGLRLLLGLPHLEREVRRVLSGSWLAEVSHFGGIWLHPSTPTLDRSVTRELRYILAAIEGPPAGSPALRESVWGTLPGELEPARSR
jgi:hypothetical protein